MFKKRIDELGRIVIPKEIRDSFKVKNFDELELYMDNESIIIKKSIGIESYKTDIDNILKLAKKIIDFDIVILDKMKIISSTSENYCYKDLVKPKIENINNGKFEGILFEEKYISCYLSNIPLIVDSNTVGFMFIISNNNLVDNEIVSLIKNIIISLME